MVDFFLESSSCASARCRKNTILIMSTLESGSQFGPANPSRLPMTPGTSTIGMTLKFSASDSEPSSRNCARKGAFIGRLARGESLAGSAQANRLNNRGQLASQFAAVVAACVQLNL